MVNYFHYIIILCNFNYCLCNNLSEVIYRYDGGVIIKADVETKIETELRALKEKKNKLLNDTANVILEERLLEKEAKQQNKTREELIKGFISKNFSPVSEDKCKEFYLKQKSYYKKPYEKMKGEIRNLFDEQQREALKRNYFFSLKKKYEVEKEGK